MGQGMADTEEVRQSAPLLHTLPDLQREHGSGGGQVSCEQYEHDWMFVEVVVGEYCLTLKCGHCGRVVSCSFTDPDDEDESVVLEDGVEVTA